MMLRDSSSVLFQLLETCNSVHSNLSLMLHSSSLPYSSSPPSLNVITIVILFSTNSLGLVLDEFHLCDQGSFSSLVVVSCVWKLVILKQLEWMWCWCLMKVLKFLQLNPKRRGIGFWRIVVFFYEREDRAAQSCGRC